MRKYDLYVSVGNQLYTIKGGTEVSAKVSDKPLHVPVGAPTGSRTLFDFRRLQGESLVEIVVHEIIESKGVQP